MAFAGLCYDTGRYGASARLAAAAFQAGPALAEDLGVGHRYAAACAAALAGCGNGRDVPPLDEPERARWRAQSLAWLAADLDGWIKVLDSHRPQGPDLVRQRLAHWRVNPDLAGLRETTALDRLPEPERKAWQAFWAKVGAQLARAQGRPSR
jgi:hypothetical protein